MKQHPEQYSAYLELIGAELSSLVLKKGYTSPYEFWIQNSDGHFSGQTSNYILNWKKDCGLSTLKIIEDLLETNLDEILFKVRD